MSAAYPLLVDLTRLRVLVVGGGAVALRKVRGMLEAGGRPAVVAMQVSPGLRTLLEAHRLHAEERPYRADDVAGMALVFAATADAAVNRAVAADARAAGALVSSADDGGESDFHLPATLRQGPLVLSLATGGASPLLARLLLARLEAVVTPGVGRAASRLAQLRRRLRSAQPEEALRRGVWTDLISEDFLDAAIAGRDDDVEQHIARCLSQS